MSNSDMDLARSQSLATAMATFAHRLSRDGVPAHIDERARVCLLNGYGIAVGCIGTPYALVAAQAALATDGEQANGATLLADGRRASINGAALANSALFHGRAQEDTCGAAHLGAILLPLLTALIEGRERAATSRLLPALIAGYEIGGLLEKAYSGFTTPAGLRSSPLYGTVSAAAATAVLMDLSVEQTAAALSNAASFTGGILQSFDDGTDEWRYQVGMAGRTGWMATELARAGSVSAPHAFEGRNGFVQAFARVDCNVQDLVAQLGHQWSLERVTFKPFPVCAFNQTPVHAALALREKLGGRRITGVRVRMNPYEAGYAGMDATGPFGSISGTLMSIPFCIATTLLHGTPTMTHMTSYGDAQVNALIERIRLQADDQVSRLCCAVELTLEGGETLEHDQRMTTADYAYDRAGVRALIRRVGAESSIPEAVYEGLERVVDSPAQHFDELFACFQSARQAVQSTKGTVQATSQGAAG